MGRRIVISGPGGRTAAEIVGVAGDAKYTELRGATPATIYMPALQMPRRDRELRAAPGRGQAAGSPLPGHPGQCPRRQPGASRARPPHAGRADQSPPRAGAPVRTALRLLRRGGAALACVGLYGLMSLRRVRGGPGEIGYAWRSARPRASAADDSRRIADARAVRSRRRFGRRLVQQPADRDDALRADAGDPATYATVALGLGAVALLASLLPARRASRIDPIVALRIE